MIVAVSGASGLLGSALTAWLLAAGHQVRPMRRGRSGAEIDLGALAGADGVVHLAGAGIADQRWTSARKQQLVRSRVDFTRTLVGALASLATRPRVLVSGSAVGIYGDRGDEVLTEASPPGPVGDGKGSGFLCALCEAWEAEARHAERLGMRVVLARTGLVLTPHGGALAKLLPPFRAGLGGPLGGGRHWMSWITLEDAVGALAHALRADSLAGPANLVAPGPVTNAEFTLTLGRVLSRPAVLPLPAFALRFGLGELADGLLLTSQRVLPGALEASNFRFNHPSLELALRATLGLD